MTATHSKPAAQRQAARPQRISSPPADSPALDWSVALLSVLLILGVFLDGWAHNHGRTDDTFFTPWHAVLYGTYALAGLFLTATHFRSVRRGHRWSSALPRGYMPSLAGVFIFAAFGAADMVWHEAFGIENSLEALLSPTHLGLAAGGLLIASGPIRAHWQRHPNNPHSMLPAILAMTAIASLLTFMLSFATITGFAGSLTGYRPPNAYLYDIYGVMSVVMPSSILLGSILFMRRRWHLPFGTVTWLLTANSALMIWLHFGTAAELLFVVKAAAVGMLGDALLSRAAWTPPTRLRLFAFALPFAYGLGALAVLQILGTSVWRSGGLWWEIHMWLGAPVLAGAFGIGLSLLAAPPAIPSAATKRR